MGVLGRGGVVALTRDRREHAQVAGQRHVHMAVLTRRDPAHQATHVFDLRGHQTHSPGPAWGSTSAMIVAAVATNRAQGRLA